MGNRAVVTFASKKEVEQYYAKGKGGIDVSGFTEDHPNLVGVYLHWNGGKDSIVPFCRACKQIGFRCPTDDFSYGVARFVQLVANYFGGLTDTSVGVNTLEHLDCDNYDNGVFVVGEDWEIVGREFMRFDDEPLDEKKVDEFVKYLVEIQGNIGK
jgi:hypothetical protein